MKNIISLSLLFLCAAVFAGSDPEKDFVQIPAEPGFTFARDLQSRGPRGEAGEKSPIMKPCFPSIPSIPRARETGPQKKAQKSKKSLLTFVRLEIHYSRASG